MRKCEADAKEIVSCLAASPPNVFMTCQQLAKQSEISRHMIPKAVRLLRGYGYKIQYRHCLGYRLLAGTEQPVPWELQKILRTRRLGKEVIIYKNELSSTQNTALKYARRHPSPHGLVVIAQSQTNSRGRFHRRWFSPKGGLWLSAIVEPMIPASKSTLLPLVTAVAVCAAITRISGLDVHVKWPNDIMIANKKVAGILLDSCIEGEFVSWAVIGIGVNVNFPASSILGKVRSYNSSTPTSLLDELGRCLSLLDFTALLLEDLENVLDLVEDEVDGGLEPSSIIERWTSQTKMIGKTAIVTAGTRRKEGIVTGISNDGSLVLKLEDGKHIDIASGSVEMKY